jgi:hypothetical protein
MNMSREYKSHHKLHGLSKCRFNSLSSASLTISQLLKILKLRQQACQLILNVCTQEESLQSSVMELHM